MPPWKSAAWQGRPRRGRPTWTPSPVPASARDASSEAACRSPACTCRRASSATTTAASSSTSRWSPASDRRRTRSSSNAAKTLKAFGKGEPSSHAGRPGPGTICASASTARRSRPGASTCLHAARCFSPEYAGKPHLSRLERPNEQGCIVAVNPGPGTLAVDAFLLPPVQEEDAARHFRHGRGERFPLCVSAGSTARRHYAPIGDWADAWHVELVLVHGPDTEGRCPAGNAGASR